MTKNTMPLPKLDDLFTTQEERIDNSLEKVINININEIDEFPNHPFKVLDNEDMAKMVDSINDKGVLVPAIVRKKSDGRYEMISGHRRKRASELINLETIPCIVRDLTDDEATIIMVDSNMQREEILPSERAFAYKLKLDAINHQGKSFGQVGQNLYSRDLLAETSNDSSRQIQRYIRLTKLIPELLDMVDNKKIAFNPAVELSYLTEEEQYFVFDYIGCYDATPSHSQAIEMKKLSQSGKLNDDIIEEIMSREKANQVPTIKINEARIKKVLPRNIDNSKIEDFVLKSVEFYSKYLKQKELNSKSNLR